MMDDNACGATPYDSPAPSSSPSGGGSSTNNYSNAGLCRKCLGFWTIVLIAAVVSLFVSAQRS